MPAIQVYKSKQPGVMIPVDAAKVAKAYQCPWTSDLFATKKSYVKHLKILRTTRMHRRARQLRWHRLSEDLWNQTSFEKIVRWVELHPEWFLNNAKRQSFYADANRYDRVRDTFSIKITYLDLQWDNSVSNTHYCPHNGVTNWGGQKKDAPCGYPGWQGRIEYELSHDLPGFGSDLMKGTRIHTGTGGSTNSTNYGFDVKFFADDWPGLAKGQVWETLKGTNMNSFKFGQPRYFR